jgi:CheY-like chemotaxis protein
MARILIVEDESTVLALAESILRHAGYETLSAGTVAEAQAIINSDQKVDLVCTDLALANHPEGGLKIGQLAKSRGDIPVLYTSGRPATDGLQELFVERSSYLTKPYTDHQLVEAVSGLLRPP